MQNEEEPSATTEAPPPTRPYGDCYVASLNLAEELAQIKMVAEADPTDAELKKLYDGLRLATDISIVHGEVVVPDGLDAGRTVLHAWVEVGGHAIEGSNRQMEQHPVEVYYEHLKTGALYRYSIEEAKALLEKHKIYGPWHTMEPLTEPNRTAAVEIFAEMSWGLTREVLGCPPFLPLAEAEFSTLKAAQLNILLALRVEEKFDALLQNYADYEREILSLTLEHSLFQEIDWSRCIGDLQAINRRLANVLTMARTYLDHTKQDASAIFASGDATIDEFDTELRCAYDSLLGYRVMEALRNHMQHCGFPIGGISYPSEWLGTVPSDQARLRYRITVHLDMDGLTENRKFKNTILNELEGSNSADRDVGILLRQYVEGLSRAHERLREMWAKTLATCEQTIVEAIERYRTFGDGIVAGLAAVSLGANKKVRERTQIFDDPIKRLSYLRKKNAILTNISRRYISNELP
jgi:hypothetical protein